MVRRDLHGSNVSNVPLPDNNFPNPSGLSEYQDDTHVLVRGGVVFWEVHGQKGHHCCSRLYCTAIARVSRFVRLSPSTASLILLYCTCYDGIVWCLLPKVMHRFLLIGIYIRPRPALHAFGRADDHFIRFLPCPKKHTGCFSLCSRMSVQASAMVLIFRSGLQFLFFSGTGEGVSVGSTCNRRHCGFARSYLATLFITPGGANRPKSISCHNGAQQAFGTFVPVKAPPEQKRAHHPMLRCMPGVPNNTMLSDVCTSPS